MLADLRYVVRSLLRNRGFTLVTVLTLSLGIGAGGAIFSATDWILFRRSMLPAGTFLLGGQSDRQPFNPIRYDYMVQAYRSARGAIAEMELASNQSGNVVVEDQPVDTGWLAIAPGLFPMMGIAPWRGRDFGPGDAVVGSDQVAIVSFKFWKEHLGGRDDALGRKIRVGGSVCVVVGILKESQEFPPMVYRAVYRPLVLRPDPAQPWANVYNCFVRLSPGVTREQAQEILRAAKVDIPVQMKNFMGSDQVVVADLSEFLNQFARPEIYRVLLGAVGCLYAIACLNASNLMLVRMLGMRRELGIRLALGGGRGHIVRLLMLESATLATMAALAGLLIANWVFPLLLVSIGGTDLANRSWTEWTLGWRVLAVMAGLSVVTGLVISVVPVVRVFRTDLNAGLKDGGVALGESRALARLRGALVVLQTAFAVVLLAGAGLMIRTFENFKKVELGFNPDRLIKVMVGFPPLKQTAAAYQAQLAKQHELQAAILRVPGVLSVGFGQDAILPGGYYPSFDLAGPENKIVKTAAVSFNVGYHETTGIKLRRGRWLDKPQGNEVMVNETLARNLWPGVADPVGRFVRQGNNPGTNQGWKGWEVVGVVADIRSTMRSAPGNWLYLPEAWSVSNYCLYVVRLAKEFDPSVADSLRRMIFAHDPDIIIHTIDSVDHLRDGQLWAENKASSVLKVLAAIALLLAVVGVFAVMAYSVDRRMNEFGVRMALGAMPGDLVRLVMGRGLALMVIGLVFGLGGAMALTRFMQSLLFETSALDPWVLGGVAAVLLAAAVLACFWPARRAAKVDVSQLLRSE
ncbi:MAG TPA: ABC transporter permease [Lacunisphaera sp.]|nr:ABC transporter permease [Lacunisphaera sp.]